MPLKDQDRTAWGWAEVTDPKEITHTHIFTAYRIKQNFCKNKSCRRNCRGNPFCLSGLGEARLIESITNHSDDASTTLPKRIVGNFVGLKNLGATCYVNSLLQLWFHNKAFRDGIFSWNPAEDPVEQKNMSLYTDGLFVPQTAVGHLQQLFALMYYSKSRYIDPSPLVESLRLDTSTQQDAQEFSKLLVSLIENTLRHQNSEQVSNLINNHFRGEYVYVTRCCKCLTESVSPSMFYELELNVKGHNTLNECLAEFLQEEKLEGADCYSCTVCEAKQEACRFIKLCSLPPILNLQLLRFVYDREKGQRKKLKTVVQFPETLDMKEFVNTNEEKLLYNLSAVLIHKGSRASSGHFVAYIKDGETGVWNMFNDESVVKLEGKKLKIDEDDCENPKKQKLPRLPKGFQSSTDAYMLVYTAENHKTSTTEVQLSKKVQEYVDSQNNIFDELCKDIAASKKQGLDRQEQMVNMYNSLSVDDSDDLNDIDALSADWLTSWLDYKSDNVRQIDNTKLICPHNKLDPCAVTSAKYVSSVAAESLYDQYVGGPRLRMGDVLCAPCVINQSLILRTKSKTLEESKEIANLLKRRMGVDEPGFYVSKNCLKTWRTKVLNMVEGKNNSSSKTSIREGSTGSSEDVSEPTTDESAPASLEKSLPGGSIKVENVADKSDESDGQVVERRRMLRESKYRKILRKRKPTPTVTVPLSEIRDCFDICKRLEVSLVRPNDLAKKEGSSSQDQCKILKVKLQRLTVPTKSVKLLNNLRRNSSEKRKEISSINAINGENFENNLELKINGENTTSSNPQQCDNDEKVLVKQEDEALNNFDDELNSSRVFNEGITCPHGNLSIEEAERKLIPVRVWEILKQYFPQASSFSQDATPCLQCQNLASKDEVVKQHLYDSALIQKKELSDLFHLRNRPVPGKTADTIYILHKQYFHQPWYSFIKSSTKRDASIVMDPPSTLMVDLLLCVHGLLQYSPGNEDDLSRLVLATKQEWEILCNMYTTNLAVTINPDLSTSPELCETCMLTRLAEEQKEKLTYDRARLNIRLVPPVMVIEEDLESSESSETGQPYKRPRLTDAPFTHIPSDLKVMKNLTSASDVRRSARTRKTPGQKDVNLFVSSDLTLRELKQMITNQLAVAPFDQHLSTQDGRELCGDYCTLSEFGILPNTTLLLQVDEPKESFDDTLEECSTPTEPETGFKGTGLLHAY